MIDWYSSTRVYLTESLWQYVWQSILSLVRKLWLWSHICVFSCIIFRFAVIPSLSFVQLFVIPWTTAHQAPLSFTLPWSFLKLMSIESVIPFNHLTFVALFFSYLQSFPASGSFPMSQLFASGGHSIGVSASTSVLPMNTQDWSPLGWTGLISLQSKELSRVFSTPQFKSINSSVLSLLYSPTLTYLHDYWKNHSFD